MDKQERRIVRRQLAHVNRETQISDVQILDLDIEKVWCCLAHFKTVEQAPHSRPIRLAA